VIIKYSLDTKTSTRARIYNKVIIIGDSTGGPEGAQAPPVEK